MHIRQIFSIILLGSLSGLCLEQANATVVNERVVFAEAKVVIEPLCADSTTYFDCAYEAKPRSSPSYWLIVDDYPYQSLRENQSGAVVVKLYIDRASGRVNECVVTKSSGFVSLDTASCLHLKRRARFLRQPATNAISQTIHFRARVVWLAAWAELRRAQ